VLVEILCDASVVQYKLNGLFFFHFTFFPDFKTVKRQHSIEISGEAFHISEVHDLKTDGLQFLIIAELALNINLEQTDGFGHIFDDFFQLEKIRIFYGLKNDAIKSSFLFRFYFLNEMSCGIFYGFSRFFV